MSNIKFDNFEVLKNWLNVDKRENYVIVRNWPFGLNESSVFRLLWNYDLINIIDVVSDVTNEKEQYYWNLIILKMQIDLLGIIMVENGIIYKEKVTNVIKKPYFINLYYVKNYKEYKNYH